MRRAAVCLVTGAALCMGRPARAQEPAPDETRLVIESGGWHLVGDLRLPPSERPVPAVVLLNEAAGDRNVYAELAEHLAARGIASLRLDLRGHGESTNLGRFVPGAHSPDPLIWDSEADVINAQQYLRSHPRIDADRIGLVGASYSGEEMAEAGREDRRGQAYVALSPGSLSEESIRDIDARAIPWLYIASRDERFLQEVTASVLRSSHTAEVIIVPGMRHATDILASQPGMAEWIAVWLAQRLR